MCDLVFACVKSLGQDKFFHTLLTALVRKEPPALGMFWQIDGKSYKFLKTHTEEALELVREMRNRVSPPEAPTKFESVNKGL